MIFGLLPGTSHFKQKTKQNNIPLASLEKLVETTDLFDLFPSLG